MKIAISDITSVVQIAFYITGSTVAVLTYKSAKKGLLNTVNTEYQKRVMDRLEALSNALYSEFEPGSDEYEYSKNLAGKDTVLSMLMQEVELYKISIAHNIELKPAEKYRGAVRRNSLENRLIKLINHTKSDPFLPDEIANHVVEKLTFRQKNIQKIVYEEFNEFREMLYGQQFTYLESLPYETYSKIISRLHDAGCGSSQVEEEVHKIRILIREYLKSFNPLQK